MLVRCNKMNAGGGGGGGDGDGGSNTRGKYTLRGCVSFAANSSLTSCPPSLNSNELLCLRGLPQHPCVVTFFTDFVDTIGQSILDKIPADFRDSACTIADIDVSGGGSKRSQFYLTSAHNRTLAAALSDFPRGSPVPLDFAVGVLIDVGNALLHCLRYGVVHMNLSLENVMVDTVDDVVDGQVRENNRSTPTRAVVCNFGWALKLDDTATMTEKAPRDPLDKLAGNGLLHSPELHNAFAAHEAPLCFAMQPSFELGVLGYTMLVGEHPISTYRALHPPIEYKDSDLVDLTAEWCGGNHNESTSLAPVLQSLVKSNPVKRLKLEVAVARLEQVRREIRNAGKG